MPNFLARVYVVPKPGINDPQGLTIRGALKTLGFQQVGSVRAGKYMEVRLESQDLPAAQGQVQQMCQKLLANPLIEDFRFEVAEVT